MEKNKATKGYKSRNSFSYLLKFCVYKKKGLFEINLFLFVFDKPFHEWQWFCAYIKEFVLIINCWYGSQDLYVPWGRRGNEEKPHFILQV